jgi:PAS domain S-box-containing protein
LLLHLLAQFSNNWQSINLWVISALTGLILSSVFRLFLVRDGCLRERSLDFLTAVDLSIFLALIWSYQFAYDHPASGILKSPSFILMTALIALRALRFHPRPIIIAGATAAIGWFLIVLLSLAVDGIIAVTHDYSEYLTSYKILLGAELEKIVALVALTIFLAAATYHARGILSTAAHATDYSEALAAAQTNLEDASEAKKQALDALSELQKRDAELTDQNDRFNAALENMSQGLCMFDAEARLIVCNEIYASMYGLTPEMVKPGVTLNEIVKYRVANDIYAGANPEDYIRERDDWTRDPSFERKMHELSDGRVIANTRQPLPNGGWVSTHEDITERKRIEAELIEHRDHLQKLVNEATADLKAKAQELEASLAKEKELNELQRQFVSMASHEFRTPLSIIDGSAQILAKKGDDLTTEYLIKRTGKIRNAVLRMTQLMESTLSAARLEEGKTAVDIRSCDIGRLISGVCGRLQEIAQDHVISCEMSNLPENIKADASALDQVLTNLLSNAIKYAPDRPDILVKAFAKGDDVIIQVRDQGLGIDVDDLPKMFGRFFRAKTSAGIAGTGIGLTLVKALVEMHDGTVSIDSKRGEGSTFTVRLPINGPTPSKKAA